MCTASWLTWSDGYELFCNRDELKTRRPARPPAIQRRNGVSYIAPTDAEAGGSWIAVNEFGLTLCLLNHYPAVAAVAGPTGTQPPTSRGRLLISLTDRRSADEVAAAVEGTDLHCYRPFRLLAMQARAAPVLLTWDGAGLARDSSPSSPVTTSSFDPANVIRARRERFAVLDRLDAGSLRRLHLSAGDAYAVCMSREDAETVSFSHVSVEGERIEFEYRARRRGGGFAAPHLLGCPRQRFG
jgi:hypothetical protein